MYIPALAREHWYDGFHEGAKDLIKAMESVGLERGQRIVFINAMFGWTAESFLDSGYGPISDNTTDGRIVCVEQSVWIQANKAGNAVISILDEDITTSNGRRNIRLALGDPNQTIDWVITYEVLPNLNDADCMKFYEYAIAVGW
jgi:hypothetical protein